MIKIKHDKEIQVGVWDILFAIGIFLIGVEVGIILAGGTQPTKTITVEKIVQVTHEVNAPIVKEFAELKIRESLPYKKLAELNLMPIEYDTLSEWEQTEFMRKWEDCKLQGWDSMICMLEED